MLFPSPRCSLCVFGIAILTASTLLAEPRLNALAPLPSAIVPGVGDVLYDQSANQTLNGFASQDFTDAGGVNDAFDSVAADDFEVPPGEVWTVTGVGVSGFFGAGAPGPVDAVDIILLSDSGGGLPGTEICSYDDVVPTTQAGGSLTAELPAPCEIPEGRVWLSAQAALPLAPNGQWFWFNVSPASYSPFLWRNPGNGFGTSCIDFSVGTACGAVDPDLSFVIRGSRGNAPAELPIPTLGTVSLMIFVFALALASLAVMHRRTELGQSASARQSESSRFRRRW